LQSYEHLSDLLVECLRVHNKARRDSEDVMKISSTFKKVFDIVKCARHFDQYFFSKGITPSYLGGRHNEVAKARTGGREERFWTMADIPSAKVITCMPKVLWLLEPAQAAFLTGDLANLGDDMMQKITSAAKLYSTPKEGTAWLEAYAASRLSAV
jgi:hypothetical protein